MYVYYGIVDWHFALCDVPYLGDSLPALQAVEGRVITMMGTVTLTYGQVFAVLVLAVILLAVLVIALIESG